MRAEIPDQNIGISRRELLAGGAAIGAAVGAYTAIKAYDRATAIFSPHVPEAVDTPSEKFEAGVVAIYEGVNIRSAPAIPDRSRFKKPDNRINWGEIDTVNGVSLEGKSAFAVVNPSIVIGQNTLQDFVHDYNFDQGYYWIKLVITKKGETASNPYYINHSRNTEELVRLLGYAGYVDVDSGEEGPAGMYLIANDKLPSTDIGRVVVPKGTNSIAADIVPRLWSERMREKFNKGGGKGEVLINNVQVVASGPESEVSEMRRLKTPVNVREYPSMQYGNGEKVKIIGGVPLGTVISEALFIPRDYQHYEFAVVRSEDFRGPLVDSQGNLFTPAPGAAYAIDKIYLSPLV